MSSYAMLVLALTERSVIFVHTPSTAEQQSSWLTWILRPERQNVEATPTCSRPPSAVYKSVNMCLV